MIYTDQTLYLQTLQQLQAAGIQYCVIGTFGLGLYNADFLLYSVTDCDLIVKNEAENLNKLAKALQELHWQLYLWEEPVMYPLPLEELAGKYYIRARQQEAILDATYEYESISWSTFEEQINYIEGIPVASMNHILYMKKRRNLEKDRQVVEHVEALLSNRNIVK
ncbi:hypothetical protein GXP67_13985 [Rhodocytophaga rosea]|uniref:Nucleotidyltransferase family protein n=1 Tax=Rhodocytophaga rosea TaxID=2704465 RepID=A0A6C0GIX2_9BACT|nr:hypothetical protein [Rhodocytophaga rosea]QHT67660.1 hypothetical protein GXP67_13985 [Rhodocytophaga rosea]